MREATQQSHRGGFASSIRTEKTEDSAGLDREREVLHRMNVTVALAQMIKHNDGFIHVDLYCDNDLDLQPWAIG